MSKCGSSLMKIVEVHAVRIPQRYRARKDELELKLKHGSIRSVVDGTREIRAKSSVVRKRVSVVHWKF
jgi:hypothetical protein